MAENKRKPPMRGRGGPGMATIEKAKDFKGTLKILVKEYLSHYKFALLVVFIFAIASTIF